MTNKIANNGPVALIDLNADVGEGGACDAELLALVSSANICCGAHAGTERDIQAALEQALALNVRPGAHPSYPDREHRGRRSMKLPGAALHDSLMQQLDYLAELAIRMGSDLYHVKPHGALYNDAARDAVLARQFCDIISKFDSRLAVTGLAGSALLSSAEQTGLNSLAEAFVDRRYQADGSLVSRQQPQAVINDPKFAVAQSLDIILRQQATSIDGTPIEITAQTLCVHGDTPQALALARQLRSALADNDVSVQSVF